MKLLLIISLLTTSLCSAWSNCCGPYADQQKDVEPTTEVTAPTKHACPACGGSHEKEDKSVTCTTCSAHGKTERLCNTNQACGEQGIQERCPTCPQDK